MIRAKAPFYRFLLVLCALAYVAGGGVEYLLDPLGRAPVLDGAENLAWAHRIAAGALPAEPLYRALLYPWVLSFSGVTGTGLALVAAFFGLLCHGVNACLVGWLAVRLWSARGAGWAAGLLYVCYPVALYFSVQVLDITFALTLFLAGLLCVVQAGSTTDQRPRTLWAVVAGVLGGLAVCTRPNFLPAVLCLPLIPLLLAWLRGEWVRASASALVILVTLCLPVVGQGVWNYQKSGEFRLLPWQGAYNLYAANRVGANGQYYMQRVDFKTVPAGMNTTRMESETLYLRDLRAEGGGLMRAEGGALDIDAMNAYWRAQLFQEIAADPGRWLGLMGKKVVYLFNDWEAYNNLSYPYQKARFAFLKWNPLGWGVLCLATLIALLVGARRMDLRLAAGLGLLFAAYAAGVLMFFVSARFRLPLAPLLCVFAGGLAVLRGSDFAQLNLKRWGGLCAALLLAGVGVYGNWYEARDERTFIQDEFLLARASATLGEDVSALSYASAVLARDPLRQDARRIQVASLFNCWFSEADSGRKAAFWRALDESLEALTDFDAATLFVGGVVAWREGAPAVAQARWAEAVEVYGAEAAMSAEALAVVADPERGDAGVDAHSALKELLFLI